MHQYRALVAAAFMMPALAHGQNLDDLEYREVQVEEEQESKLDVGALFESEWHEFNNLDFRALDESSDQAILDSDDRDSFAFTGVALNLAYEHDDQLKMVLGASHRGLWGNDQFGNTNVFGGWVYFNALYVEAATSKADNAVKFTVGRQYYRLGGLGGAPDFILADVLDMVRVDVPVGSLGSLTLIPINVVSMSQSDDGANFVSYIGQSTVQTFGFRGDHMTRRHGAVLNLDELGPVNATAYAFYSDIGALGTGSDISYEGTLGNFTDNDWVANFGVRAELEAGPVTPWLSFDASTGIDRKELVANDVNTDGFAASGGVAIDTSDEESTAGLKGNAYFFYALGPAYGSDGLMYSHGYTGLKAQQAGGLIANRYMGWHPTAYVGMFGISDSPQEMDRKSGTQIIHADVGYDLEQFGFNLGWWMMTDTGVSDVNFNNLDAIQPPFGYAREEFAATQRLGKMLGNEFNLHVHYDPRPEVRLQMNAGYMLTGDYYGIQIARVAGDALGSADPQNPWAISAGTRVKF